MPRKHVYIALARLALVLTAVGLFSGCATSKGTINTHNEPSYQQGSISSLAVPKIRNARLAPSESQKISRSLNQAFMKKNPDVTLVSANDFSNMINTRGLVADYADFIEDYITSGIANREFLMALAEDGVDAILLSELSNAFEEDGAYGRNAGQTRITIHATIIDTRTNDVVWTASADGIRKTATTVEGAPPIVEAIELAVEKILGALPIL